MKELVLLDMGPPNTGFDAFLWGTGESCHFGGLACKLASIGLISVVIYFVLWFVVWHFAIKPLILNWRFEKK